MKYTKNRLWSGKKKLAKRFLGTYQEILDWAMSLKEGDYVGTCDGCNRQVKDIEALWINEGTFRRCKPNKTTVIYEVVITDKNGNMHWCPGGGCVFPKQSVEEITDYYLGCADELLLRPDWLDGWPDMKADLIKKVEAVQLGRPIVDEFGEFLPEFDRAKHD